MFVEVIFHKFYIKIINSFFSDVELAAYLGCCELDELHQFLIWRRALSVAWKAKNYVTAGIVR
jgi:hypothetical protein